MKGVHASHADKPMTAMRRIGDEDTVIGFAANERWLYSISGESDGDAG